ncbi:MAG: DUF4349 domain-containing protein [Clostridiales bacterium]|nr:DUF4349 domain-containing protein [Clostridiales bacterium]
MRKFKLLFIALALIMAVTALCGCGVMVRDDVYVPEYDEVAPDYTNKLPSDSLGDTSGSYIDKDGYEEKIAKNADMTLYVDDLPSVTDIVESKIKSCGGYISSSREDMSGTGRATISIKIPSQSLDAFIDELKKEGKCTYLYINTDNITGTYYDTRARLENAQAQLEQYKLILKEAKTIDDILKVQPMIDEVQERIERYEAQLKVWDSQVSYSTVNLVLMANKVVADTEKPAAFMTFAEFFDGIKNGFMSVLSVCVNALGYITMGLVSIALPSGVILIIVHLIIRSVRRRRTKRKSNKDSEN